MRPLAFSLIGLILCLSSPYKNTSNGSGPKSGLKTGFFWRSRAWHFEKDSGLIFWKGPRKLEISWSKNKTPIKAQAHLFQKGLNLIPTRKITLIFLGLDPSLLENTYTYRRGGLGLLAWSSVLIMPDYSQWNIYVTPREMVSDSYQLLSISVGHNLGLSQICYAIQYIVVIIP